MEPSPHRAMLLGIAAFAQRTSTLIFLLGVVILSLLVTLVLQALGARVLAFAGLALPMVLAQLIGIAVAVSVANRFWPESQSRRTSTHLSNVAAAFLAGAALQFPLSALGGWVQRFFPIADKQLEMMYELVYPEGLLATLVSALGIGVVVPICEEWLYRRTVLSRLSQRFGESASLAISALLFGLAHLLPHAVVAATVAGFVLGWLYLRAGFRAAVAFHMGVNLTPFVARPDWIPIAGFNLIEDSSSMPIALWVAGVVLGSASLFLTGRSCNSRPEASEPL